MKNITVQWLGHACYKLTFGDWTCVIDPYDNGSVPGIGDLQVSALEVLCSHDHHDHNAAHLVKQVRMFAPAPQITTVDTFHDDAQGAKRGKNTVHVFEYEGMTLAHFGDLGHILTQQQAEAIGPVDVALIPVGGFYTIDPQQAVEVAKQVEAKVVIPMHYRTDDFGFDVIAHIDDFTALCDNVVEAGEDTIVIDENTPEMTAVLTPHFLKKAGDIMRCPYCSKDMEKGQIYDRIQVKWQKDKSLFPETVNLSKAGILGGYAVAYLCADCKKVIVDYSDVE